MPAPLSNIKASDYNQTSFIGGMNMLLDDTHIGTNQYRVGFNVRNRYDRLDLISSSVEDIRAPKGIKQEMVTFGNYEILFVAGKAFYKYYTDIAWRQIQGFAMSTTAPRYWTCPIPVAETNYYRIAATSTVTNSTAADKAGQIRANVIAGASQGNLPGLVVQDNQNQPQFIFLDNNNTPACRTIQQFSQWSITFTDMTNTVVVPNGDQREYVPIGNAMAFVDGILYVASPDGNYIYRSVSGRPLDFVINVSNLLATVSPYIQYGGGDATTTAYSVGVGPITCMRALSNGALFVAAGNANFSVAKNRTPNAPTIFGEYDFIRTFLFNANCLSDRVIFDSLGDTRFIDSTGVRSFNAVQQTQNEGRNLPFTATVQPAFTIKDKVTGKQTNILQDTLYSAAMLANDYELYGVQTVFGPAIAIYDTINQCWTSFDIEQTGNKRVKIFCKIELSIQAYFAVTEDDRVYQLYFSNQFDTGTVRTIGISANMLYAGQNIKLADPKYQIKPKAFRAILNNITQDCSLSVTPYINNRKSSIGVMTKNITYVAPPNPTIGVLSFDDTDTMLQNLFFSTPDCEQGWKCFVLFGWTSGSITQFSAELSDLTPMNPTTSQ